MCAAEEHLSKIVLRDIDSKAFYTRLTMSNGIHDRISQVSYNNKSNNVFFNVPLWLFISNVVSNLMQYLFACIALTIDVILRQFLQYFKALIWHQFINLNDYTISRLIFSFVHLKGDFDHSIFSFVHSIFSRTCDWLILFVSLLVIEIKKMSLGTY